MQCHTDIADHQPDGDLCTGCHTFIDGKPGSPLTPVRIQDARYGDWISRPTGLRAAVLNLLKLDEFSRECVSP
jgi:hypothetical protein